MTVVDSDAPCDVDVLVWGCSAPVQAAMVAVWPQLTTARAGAIGLQAALDEAAWDVVVVRPDPASPEESVAAVRATPPGDALFLVGADATELFPDAARLDYDVWYEPDPALAAELLERVIASAQANAALAAVAANRTMLAGLNEVLRLDAPVGDAMERAMGVLAGELGCLAAAYWSVTSSADRLQRIACTGPVRSLDTTMAGDDRRPDPGCDRLLVLPVEGTPAGRVLRTGQPSWPSSTDANLIIPAASDGEVSGVVVLVGARDVARRRLTFELAVSAAAQMAGYVRRRDAESRFAAVTGSTSDAIVLTGATGTVLGFNVGAERIFGLPAAEALDRPVAELFDLDWWASQSAGLSDLVARAPLGGGDHVREVEARLHDGAEVPIEVSVSTWSQGEDRRFATIMRDVSERRGAEARIRQLAYTDPVTGLGNQLALYERIEDAPGDPALLVVEIERFDTISALLGLSAAEELLRGLAARLADAVGPNGEVFRRPGRAFMIMTTCITPAELRACSERVDRAVGLPLRVEGTELRLAPRVSAALSADMPRAGRGAALVDRALRAASSVADGIHGAELLQLEAELRQAIAGDGLVLHYQPVIELATDRIHGVEALVRWEHPRRGLLGPGAFLPLAEESDLILDLGAWVADAACRQAGAWERDGHELQVSFNLSPRQLVHERAAAQLDEVVRAGHVDPARLVVEVTETSALQDFEMSTRTLERLREQGVGVALDDFGVGESSLDRLARLPVDVLKIDRSFVRDLPESRAACALTDAAIRLATGLGLSPHAEGVETVAQRDWLGAAGCALAQGFLFSRPVPAAAISDLANRPMALSR